MTTGCRAVRTAVAALLVAVTASLGQVSAASAAPAPPADEADGPGEVPFGEQVEPGTGLQDATVVTTGTYALPVPSVDAPHFFEVERAEPGDVIWYGATALASRPTGGAELQVVGTAEGVESDACNDLSATPLDKRSVVTALFSSNRNGVCRDADSITIRVDNLPVLSDPLSTGDSYQLTIWVEPAVESTDPLPAPNENSPYVDVTIDEDDVATPLDGASTFAGAEVLEDGFYETTIRQGEPSIHAIPLTYGQHVQVVAGLPVPERNAFLDLTPVWISPLGGVLRAVEPSQSPYEREVSLGGGVGVWSTPIVTWANRQRTGDVDFAGEGGGRSVAAPAAFAGTYFLLLEVPADEVPEARGGYPEEIVLQLVVRTVTDYEGRAPSYEREPPALSSLDGSGATATAEQARAAELARREAAAEPPPWVLAVGLLALAGLLERRLRRGAAGLLRGRA